MDDCAPGKPVKEVVLNRFETIIVLEIRLPFGWRRNETSVAIKVDREGDPVSCALCGTL